MARESDQKVVCGPIPKEKVARHLLKMKRKVSDMRQIQRQMGNKQMAIVRTQKDLMSTQLKILEFFDETMGAIRQVNQSLNDLKTTVGSLESASFQGCFSVYPQDPPQVQDPSFLQALMPLPLPAALPDTPTSPEEPSQSEDLHMSPPIEEYRPPDPGLPQPLRATRANVLPTLEVLMRRQGLNHTVPVNDVKYDLQHASRIVYAEHLNRGDLTLNMSWRTMHQKFQKSVVRDFVQRARDTVGIDLAPAGTQFVKRMVSEFHSQARTKWRGQIRDRLGKLPTNRASWWEAWLDLPNQVSAHTYTTAVLTAPPPRQSSTTSETSL
ncbi:hypothetical protein BC940DRAFT_301124 [Gongronella butleri]|nr:hypothetical protein BC940DRAFT_301124 [Gongronella butleri]